jgi:hypothetical protein
MALPVIALQEIFVLPVEQYYTLKAQKLKI